MSAVPLFVLDTQTCKNLHKDRLIFTDIKSGKEENYAVIKDFDIENDVIQLHRSSANYELENVRNCTSDPALGSPILNPDILECTHLGVNIYYISDGNDDLVGFVEDVDASELIFGTNLEVDFV